MDLDLRVPIGLFFVAVGLIMGIFGLISDPAIYAKSLGINVNLYWGLAQLIFGSLMLAFGRSHHVHATGAVTTASPGAAPLPDAVPVARAVTARYDDTPPPVRAAKPKPKPKPPVPHG